MRSYIWTSYRDRSVHCCAIVQATQAEGHQCSLSAQPAGGVEFALAWDSE